MKRLVLIKDGIGITNRKEFVKLTTPCYSESFFDSDGEIAFLGMESSFDMSQLLLDQIFTLALESDKVRNIFVIRSNNLSFSSSSASINTVRFFVKERKREGDDFVYFGDDRLSSIIASLWGFRKLSMVKKE